MYATVQRLLGEIARIAKALQSNEPFLDASCIYESPKQSLTSRLVVGAACTSSSKRLLSNDRASTLLVQIDIACRVSESIKGLDLRGSILSEARGELELDRERKNAVRTWRLSKHIPWSC